MTRRMLAVLLLMTAALGGYSYRLDFFPASLRHDEIDLSLQAQSIARTAHDADGRLLPVYFHARDRIWMQPLPVYFTALFLTTMHLSEFAVRLPTVILAIVDVALLYAIARSLFGRDRPAAIASGLLVLTPAFFIHSRLALSSSYPVPFVLAWLLCLIAWVQHRRQWTLWAATFCLGVGFFSDPTAVLTMPAYLAVTLATVRVQRGSTRLCAVAATGFLVPLLVLIPWFAWLPLTFRYTLNEWGLHGVAHPIEGLRYSILNWHIVGRRAGLYWGFFSPSYLFFDGGDNLARSIGQSGVFLSLTAIFLVWGLRQVITLCSEQPMWHLVLLGFALAPLAAAAFDEPRAVARALCMLPFGVLIAAAGVESLLTARRPAVRAIAVGILCLLPMQFSRFSSDYFAQDRGRSNGAFGGQAGGAWSTRLAWPAHVGLE